MLLEFSQKTFPGMLITFDGLDGTGKTTLINMLHDKLRSLGYEIFLMKHPTDAVRKHEFFKRIVSSSDLTGFEYRSLSLLSVSDFLQNSLHLILPKLKNGYVVIYDRYFYTTLANLRARDYREDKWIYEIANYIPSPDIAFFLDVAFDLTIKRIRERPNEKEKWINMEFEKIKQDEYKYICNISNGILVDSSTDPIETFKHIWNSIENCNKFRTRRYMLSRVEARI